MSLVDNHYTQGPVTRRFSASTPNKSSIPKSSLAETHQRFLEEHIGAQHIVSSALKQKAEHITNNAEPEHSEHISTHVGNIKRVRAEDLFTPGYSEESCACCGGGAHTASNQS